jgi:hypothetical protein
MEADSSRWLLDCRVERISDLPIMGCRTGRERGDRWWVVPDEPTVDGVCVPMRARIGGLTRFEIFGTLLDQYVVAGWDGMHLRLSRALWSVVSSSSCFETTDDGLVCSEDPRRVALQLVRALSHLVSIEFNVWCDRVEISRRWYFDGTASSQLDGGLIAEGGR